MFVLDDNGCIVNTHFFVEGRKCPLEEIQERKLKEFKDTWGQIRMTIWKQCGEEIVDKLTTLDEKVVGKNVD